jgi:hypothetical protein
MPQSESTRATRFLLILFWPLTALVLFCDSRVTADHFQYGQWLSGLMASAFLLALMSRVSPQRQLLLALFVPLSATGEAIFSLFLGLYHYRSGSIPLYVPFGHSILMAVGLIMSDSAFVQRHGRRLCNGLLLFHGGLIAATLLWRGDTLSSLFAVLFVVILRGRCDRPFYLILGLLVLYVEILGTFWGCWTWRPDPFGILQTTNPPPGAFTCYVIGDILAIQIAVGVERSYRRFRPRLITAIPDL